MVSDLQPDKELIGVNLACVHRQTCYTSMSIIQNSDMLC